MDYKDAANLSLLADSINHSRASTLNAEAAATHAETAAMMTQGLVNIVEQRNALLAEVASLKQQLAVAQANAAGINAQARALLAETPQTPLMAGSGIPYKSKDGVKTKLRCIYEEAFDVAARKRGLEHPEQHRED